MGFTYNDVLGYKFCSDVIIGLRIESRHIHQQIAWLWNSIICVLRNIWCRKKIIQPSHLQVLYSHRRRKKKLQSIFKTNLFPKEERADILDIQLNILLRRYILFSLTFSTWINKGIIDLKDILTSSLSL